MNSEGCVDCIDREDVLDLVDSGVDWRPSFCPNCGATMQEGKHD